MGTDRMLSTLAQSNGQLSKKKQLGHLQPRGCFIGGTKALCFQAWLFSALFLQSLLAHTCSLYIPAMQ